MVRTLCAHLCMCVLLHKNIALLLQQVLAIALYMAHNIQHFVVCVVCVCVLVC